MQKVNVSISAEVKVLMKKEDDMKDASTYAEQCISDLILLQKRPIQGGSFGTEGRQQKIQVSCEVEYKLILFQQRSELISRY